MGVHSTVTLFMPGLTRPCDFDTERMPMDAISVMVRRFVDDSFPGFVECILVDADGRAHHVVEKVPCFTVLLDQMKRD